MVVGGGLLSRPLIAADSEGKLHLRAQASDAVVNISSSPAVEITGSSSCPVVN